MRVTFWYPNEAAGAGAKRAREEAALSNPPSWLFPGSVSCPFRFRVVTDCGAENAEREVQREELEKEPCLESGLAPLPLQGEAKGRELSLVREVPSGLIGCASATLT